MRWMFKNKPKMAKEWVEKYGAYRKKSRKRSK